MRFYKVWVRSLSYRGHEPLTYSSESQLIRGQIVIVQLQRQEVLGFVSHEVTKPTFSTKPVVKAYPLPPLPAQLLELASWLQLFYATTLGTATQQLLPAALTDKAIAELHNVVAEPIKPPLHLLNKIQYNVVKNITKPDTYLLHGRTGSGKTRVYIELALQALAAGRSTLILVPEISLTSQLAQSFRDVFSDRVVVLHSQLTTGQRQKAWLKILTLSASSHGIESPTVFDNAPHTKTPGVPEVKSSLGAVGPSSITPLVVIGPRSALFSPLANIGLVVVDEAHETAYKQEQAPYYHALRVASQLAHLHQATLIIGSATPSISDYYMAEQRGKPILEMKELATSGAGRASEPLSVKRSAKAGLAEPKPTDITLVDIKDRSQFSRSRHLSTPMVEAITKALASSEQSLIYLNRRGTARVILCENCGWQALCPHCDLPLVYHGDTSSLRCHTCGYHQGLITSCPVCGNPSILFKSFGTKAVYDEIQRLFPEAHIQRFDTDNKKSERFEQHYQAIKDGTVDILIGTQLIAKGLDLPRLSTLGIVLADSSLYLPDFSSQERTYQLLSQVLGRVGRGHRHGRAIIQTYHVDNPILQAAVTHNWDEFYHAELKERQKFHFPPFYHLLKLSCRRTTPKSAELAALKLKQSTSGKFPGIEIDGPAPAFHEKLSGKYQYQLVVKSTNRSQLLEIVKSLPSGWSYDIDPVNLL